MIITMKNLFPGSQSISKKKKNNKIFSESGKLFLTSKKKKLKNRKKYFTKIPKHNKILKTHSLRYKMNFITTNNHQNKKQNK